MKRSAASAGWSWLVMKVLLPESFMITDVSQVDALAAAKRIPASSAIILRDYNLSYEKRLQLGLALKKICRRKKMMLLVAKDIKLALALKADGMHFPEFMLTEAKRMKAKKPDWLVTIAAHSKPSILMAYNNLDAVLISPVKKTPSHPHKKPMGIQRASLLIYKSLPAYALGGVTISDKKFLKYKGFAGFAGISWSKGCVKIATVAE